MIDDKCKEINCKYFIEWSFGFGVCHSCGLQGESCNIERPAEDRNCPLYGQEMRPRNLIIDALDKIDLEWRFPLDKAIYMKRTWGHGRLQECATEELSKRLAQYLFDNDFIELKEETAKNEVVFTCSLTFLNKKKLNSNDNKEGGNEC